MTDQEFIVTTAHPAPRFAGEHVFRVRESSTVCGLRAFYAVSPEFGCSRDCETPRAAIRNLVQAAGASLLSVGGVS